MPERNGGDRIEVRKTYKQFVGGEFVRSESGRAYRPDGAINVPRGSRKDLRDAVNTAKGPVALLIQRGEQQIYVPVDVK